LVEVLHAVVEVPVLAMFHPRKYLLLGRAVAFQLVGDDHPRHIGQPLPQLAEELLRRLLVAAALHQNIENVPALVNGAPEVIPLAIDREEDFIQVPRVAGFRPAAPELMGILLPKLAAPLADRLIVDDHSTLEKEFFDITIAQAEAEI
jgi:hypothetical protein